MKHGAYHVDVRVIAATNRNLQEEVRQGRFTRRLVLPLLGVNRDQIRYRIEKFQLERAKSEVIS